MHEEETIKQLQDENEQQKREIELLKEYIRELEARLVLCNKSFKSYNMPYL